MDRINRMRDSDGVDYEVPDSEMDEFRSSVPTAKPIMRFRDGAGGMYDVPEADVEQFKSMVQNAEPMFRFRDGTDDDMHDFDLSESQGRMFRDAFFSDAQGGLGTPQDGGPDDDYDASRAAANENLVRAWKSAGLPDMAPDKVAYYGGQLASALYASGVRGTEESRLDREREERDARSNAIAQDWARKQGIATESRLMESDSFSPEEKSEYLLSQARQGANSGDPLMKKLVRDSYGTPGLGEHGVAQSSPLDPHAQPTDEIGTIGRLYMQDVASKGADEGVMEFLLRRVPVVGTTMKTFDIQKRRALEGLANGSFSNSVQMGNAAHTIGIPDETIRRIQEAAYTGEKTQAGFPVVDQEKARTLWQYELEKLGLLDKRMDTVEHAERTLGEDVETGSERIAGGMISLPSDVVELTPWGFAATGMQKILNKTDDLERRGDSGDKALMKATVGTIADALIWNKLNKVAKFVPGATKVGNNVKRVIEISKGGAKSGADKAAVLAARTVGGNAAQLLDMSAKSHLTELVNDVAGMDMADGEKREEFGEWFKKFISVPGNAEKMLELLPAHLIMKGLHASKGKLARGKEAEPQLRRTAVGELAARKFLADRIGADKVKDLTPEDVKFLVHLLRSPGLTEDVVGKFITSVDGDMAKLPLREAMERAKELFKKQISVGTGEGKPGAEGETPVPESAKEQNDRALAEKRQLKQEEQKAREKANEQAQNLWDEGQREQEQKEAAGNVRTLPAQEQAGRTSEGDAATGETASSVAEAFQAWCDEVGKPKKRKNWHRFAQVVGIDTWRFDLDESGNVVDRLHPETPQAQRGTAENVKTVPVETPAQPERGPEKLDVPTDAAAQGRDSVSEELASRRITGYQPVLKGLGEEIAEGTKLFEGGEKGNRGEFYVQKDFDLYGPFASREEAVGSALGAGANHAAEQATVGNEPAQPGSVQPAQPSVQESSAEPQVKERPNRLRRNIKSVNFRHQGENQQSKEGTNETGNVPVEAQPEPSVQDAGRGGQQQAPQAAERPVEGEAPRGEVPAAGEVAEARPAEAKPVAPAPAATQEQKPVEPVPVSKSDSGGQKSTGGAKEEATPAFKRGDSVMLKGASDGQRITFLKANADGTADVQVKTSGANRYAPEKVETRTVPMGDISSAGMKETLTLAERKRLADGIQSQAEPPSAEPPKTAPASAPREEGTTTPPQSAEPVQGAEQAAGGATGGAVEEPKPTQGNKLRRGKKGKKLEAQEPKSDTAHATQEATPEATTTPAPTAAEQPQPASQFRDKNGNMKKTLRGAVERIASAIGNRTGKGAITPEEADGIVNGIAESPEVKHNRSARFFTPLVTDAEWQNSLGVDAESAKNIRDAVVRARDASQQKKQQRKLDNALRAADAGDKDAPTAYGLIRIASDALDKARTKGDKAAEARAQKELEDANAKFNAEYEQVPEANREKWVKEQEKQFEEWSKKHDDVARNESVTADAPITGKDGSSTTMAEQLPAKGVSSGDDRGGFKLVQWEDGELVRKGRVKVEMRLKSPTTGKMLSKTVEMSRTELAAKLGKNRAADLLGGHEILASVGAPETPASRDAKFAADVDYQRWLKSRKANDAEPLRQRYEMEQAKALGDAYQNAVRGVDFEYVGDRDYDPAKDNPKSDGDLRAMIVNDPAIIDAFENPDGTITVFRAVQVNEKGEVRPPQSTQVKGVGDGAKLELRPAEGYVDSDGNIRTKDGKKPIIMAEERPDLAYRKKNAKGTDWIRFTQADVDKGDATPDMIGKEKWYFDLHKTKGNGSLPGVLMDPYMHTNDTPLADQFSSAHRRPDWRIAVGKILRSDLESGYRAEKAGKTVGQHPWNGGTVDGQLPKDLKRKVYLTRYLQLERIMPEAEAVQFLKNKWGDIAGRLVISENRLTPQMKAEMEKVGGFNIVSEAEFRNWKKAQGEKAGNTRFLHDRDTGTVLGIFDRDTGKLKLFRGASWKTLNHELGGHATMRLAEQEAARGNRSLLDKINESIDNAPQWLKDEVKSRYPDADEATLRDEIWAALRERPSEAMQKYVKTLQGRKWYNRAWDAIKTAWRGVLSRMGFNRADLSGIDKMTPDEFNEFLDNAMIGGKTLGRLETQGGEGIGSKLRKAFIGERGAEAGESSVRMARGPAAPGANFMDDVVTRGEKVRERLDDARIILRKELDRTGATREVIDPKTGFLDWRQHKNPVTGKTDWSKTTVNVDQMMDKLNGYVQKHNHILQKRYDKISRIMADNGISEELVDKYLLALHAEERNRTIATRRGDAWTPTYAEGAGVSKEWADKFLASPEVRKNLSALTSIEKIVHNVVLDDLRQRLESGRLSQDQYDFYANRWQHYVPLKTDVTAGNSLEERFNSSTAGMKRNEFITSKGRGADNIADSPLTFAFVQAGQGIQGAAKNMTGNVAANWVDFLDSKGLNSVQITDPKTKSTRTEYRVAEIVPAEVVKHGGTEFAATFADGTKARIGGDMQLASNQSNLVLFKRPERVELLDEKGRPTGKFEEQSRLYVIRFNPGANGRGLAIAKEINETNMAKVPEWLRYTGIPKFTGYLSRMNTSASPSFLFSNVINDRNEAWRALAARYGIRDGTKIAAKMHAATFTGRKYVKDWIVDGKLTPGTRFKEFIDAGGQIKGGVSAHGYAEENKILQDNLARYQREARSFKQSLLGTWRKPEMTMRLFSSIGRFNSTMNEIAELNTRAAIFSALRDSGVSVADAVRFAREGTTNFNRRGAYAPVIGSLYMYYNANVQGLKRNFQSLRDKHGLQMTATWALAASLAAMCRHYVGGKDDDENGKNDGGRNARNAPDYYKQTSIGIPLGNKAELQILKMRGLDAVIPYMATKITEASLGDTSWGDATMAIAEALEGEAAGIVGGNRITGSGGFNLLQTISPSALDSFEQLVTGKNWRGEEYRKRTFDKDAPRSYNGKDSTSWILKVAAQVLNNITGGDKLKPGLVDLAPEDIALIGETFFGGLGRDVVGAINTTSNAKKLLSGDVSDRTLSQMPMVKSVVKEYPDSSSKYFDAINEYKTSKKRYKKLGAGADRKAMKEEMPYLSVQRTRIDELVDQIDRLRHRENGKKKNRNGEWVPMENQLTDEEVKKTHEKLLRLQAEVLQKLGK